MKKLLLALAIILFASAAQAAVTANNIVTAQTPKLAVVQFLQGTDVAGTYKTLYTAGANGSKIVGISMNNNDASATHLLTVQVVNGAVKYGGTSLTTVVSAGFATSKRRRVVASTVIENFPAAIHSRL